MSDHEEWRVSPTIPALEVSSLGQVRRLKDKRPVLGVYRVDGRIQITRRVGKKWRTHYVHRLICEAFHGPPPHPRAMVLHANDIASDNRAANLRWGTVRHNVREAKLNGRTLTGRVRIEDVPPHIVDAIHHLHTTILNLAHAHHISEAQLRRILANG